jgi:hypothetical protein
MTIELEVHAMMRKARYEGKPVRHGPCEELIKDVEGDAASLVHADCPRISDPAWLPEAIRVLAPDGFLIMRAVCTAPDDCYEAHRLRDEGLATLAVVKTRNFYERPDLDGFVVAAFPGTEPREPLPDAIIHERVPLNERLNKAERDVATYVALVEALTEPGALVLDLCAGSAALGEAALLTGRRYLGFEVKELMTVVANTRLKMVERGMK